MPKTTIPTLGAVAEAQSEDKKAQKARSLFASLGALLGLGGEQKPAAKMTKKTLTTKRVEMEESDEESETSSESSSDEEDAEADSEAAEAEEGSGAEGAEDEPASEEARASVAEEPSDKALSKAVSRALNSPAVHEAFLAALPPQFRDVGALYSPHRLAASAKKATGQQTSFGAMGALAELTQKNRQVSERMLAKQAKLEQRVVKIEGARRQDRVKAIVAVAKERGVPGATSKEGREMLRDYGMQHGTAALSKFIASQGPGIPTREKIPKTDAEGNVMGLPTGEDQMGMMEQAMAGLDAKAREEFKAIAAEKLKAANGAAKVEA